MSKNSNKNTTALHRQASSATTKPAQSFSDPVPWKPDVTSKLNEKRVREGETNPEDDPGMEVVHLPTLQGTPSLSSYGQQITTGMTSPPFNVNDPLDWEPIIRGVLEDVENLENLQSAYPIEAVEGYRLRLTKVSWALEEANPNRPGSYKAKFYGATQIKSEQGPPSLIASWFPSGGDDKKKYGGK